MPVLYTVQTRTHTGNVREVNEDSVSTVLDWRSSLALADEDLQTRGHLFAVADGMGGHAAGDVASQLTIETLFHEFYGSKRPPEGALTDAITIANLKLCEQAEEEPRYAGMGTTLVAALLRGADLTVANIGDSRAYLFRDRQISRITHDHSWVAEQLAAGVLSAEEAARHPYRNVITHSLGPDRDPSPDLFHLSLLPGDRLLLCTDGLTNMVPDDELAEFLDAYQPDEAADILVERALERGAPDNVSFALIEFLGEKPDKHRLAWPWVLLAILLLLILAVQLREPFLRLVPGSLGRFATTDPSATPTPTIPPPTATPTPPPSPTPTPVLAPPPVAEPITFGLIRENEQGPVRPQPDEYVFYIRGTLADIKHNSDGWHLEIPHRNHEGQIQRYVINMREDWLPQRTPPKLGDTLSIIARPITETDTSDDIGMEPLLILDAQTQPLSVGGGDLTTWLQNHTESWIFTIYGPGGGDGLGLETPPGMLGRAIVVRGRWRPSLPDGPLTFDLSDPVPFELQQPDNIYGQPDN